MRQPAHEAASLAGQTQHGRRGALCTRWGPASVIAYQSPLPTELTSSSGPGSRRLTEDSSRGGNCRHCLYFDGLRMFSLLLCRSGLWRLGFRWTEVLLYPLDS
eukprot:364994-Chlamydomonas_euryale.AAC.1